MILKDSKLKQKLNSISLGLGGIAKYIGVVINLMILKYIVPEQMFNEIITISKLCSIGYGVMIAIVYGILLNEYKKDNGIKLLNLVNIINAIIISILCCLGIVPLYSLLIVYWLVASVPVAYLAEVSVRDKVNNFALVYFLKSIVTIAITFIGLYLIKDSSNIKYFIFIYEIGSILGTTIVWFVLAKRFWDIDIVDIYRFSHIDFKQEWGAITEAIKKSLDKIITALGITVSLVIITTINDNVNYINTYIIVDSIRLMFTEARDVYLNKQKYDIVIERNYTFIYKLEVALYFCVLLISVIITTAYNKASIKESILILMWIVVYYVVTIIINKTEVLLRERKKTIITSSVRIFEEISLFFGSVLAANLQNLDIILVIRVLSAIAVAGIYYILNNIKKK